MHAVSFDFVTLSSSIFDVSQCFSEGIKQIVENCWILFISFWFDIPRTSNIVTLMLIPCSFISCQQNQLAVVLSWRDHPLPCIFRVWLFHPFAFHKCKLSRALCHFGIWLPVIFECWNETLQIAAAVSTMQAATRCHSCCSTVQVELYVMATMAWKQHLRWVHQQGWRQALSTANATCSRSDRQTDWHHGRFLTEPFGLKKSSTFLRCMWMALLCGS